MDTCSKCMSGGEDSSVATSEKSEDHPNCQWEIRCWQKKGSVSVNDYCDMVAEKLATTGSRWTNGWAERKFSCATWLDKGAGRLTYDSSHFEVQSPFGAWIRQDVERDFDVRAKRAIGMRITPRRYKTMPATEADRVTQADG